MELERTRGRDEFSLTLFQVKDKVLSSYSVGYTFPYFAGSESAFRVSLPICVSLLIQIHLHTKSSTFRVGFSRDLQVLRTFVQGPMDSLSDDYEALQDNLIKENNSLKIIYSLKAVLETKNTPICKLILRQVVDIKLSAINI